MRPAPSFRLLWQVGIPPFPSTYSKDVKEGDSTACVFLTAGCRRPYPEAE